jgi:hypothetical protein
LPTAFVDEVDDDRVKSRKEFLLPADGDDEVGAV